MIAHFARHRTLANLVLVVMLVVGLLAVSKIRAQYFPDVVVEEVQVSVLWEGAGAEDVDRGIVQVLQPALLAVDGVSNSEARATEGRARITLEFEPGVDLAQATDDVQAAMDVVTGLPDGAEQPEVRRGGWRDRVTDVVLSGPVSATQLARFSDEFVGRLFERGVTRTSIQGLAATQTIVEVPTTSLMRHDVTMAEISAVIAAGVQTAPAGDVGDGARLRTGQDNRGPDAIAALALRANADGSKLLIGDIAQVRVEGADRVTAYFVGPNPAMLVRVDRNDQGDAIDLQSSVADVAAQMQPSLPEGVTIQLVNTRAEQITDRLKLLLNNGLMGLGLVVTLLFLFLNGRTALWVAAGIPVSMMSAIAVMYFTGMTLNMISLFALIITLGIVVDDAIVVGEHADFRARSLGEAPQLAAENAAKRMFSPVLASTLTTVIAFAALIAIGGGFGNMIADIPYTVIAVLLASLVECFLILPNHMAHALRHAAREAWYDVPSRVVMRGFDAMVAGVVRPALVWVLRARYLVMALVVLAFAMQVALFLRGDIQFRFFSGPEQAQVTGNFSMLPGRSRDDSEAMMRELQRATNALSTKYTADYGRAPLEFVMVQMGGGAGRGLSGSESKDADLLGGLSITLIDPDLREWSSASFVSDLQAEVKPVAGLEELSFRGGYFGPGGAAISVDLHGAEPEVLKAAAEAIKTALAPFPEVSGLEDTLAYDKEEIILNLTAQGEALGFRIDQLGQGLRQRLNGIEAATYPDGAREASIRVELPKGELTADFLDRTLMRSAAGDYVPLADVVTVERRSGFSAILRENGLRVVTVSGDLSEDNAARAAEIQQNLNTEILPKIAADYGITYTLSGAAEQQRAFFGDAWIGAILALLGIYACLAWIFASWTRPIVVMAVIPFGLVGAIWGHDFWDIPLSMFSIVGMIGMSGIIINDAIVLVSTIDEYAEKRGLMPAIVDGVADRLRPVFLTTATTVLGLVPLLYEDSQQAEFLMPTVVTLVYGLGFGMILVLLVVPSLMAAQADIAQQGRSLRRMLQGGARPMRLLVLGAGALMALGFVATLGRAYWVGQGAALALGLFLALAAAISLAAGVIGRRMLRSR